jgi:hypothetical protein
MATASLTAMYACMQLHNEPNFTSQVLTFTVPGPFPIPHAPHGPRQRKLDITAGSTLQLHVFNRVFHWIPFLWRMQRPLHLDSLLFVISSPDFNWNPHFHHQLQIPVFGLPQHNAMHLTVSQSPCASNSTFLACTTQDDA